MSINAVGMRESRPLGRKSTLFTNDNHDHNNNNNYNYNEEDEDEDKDDSGWG